MTEGWGGGGGKQRNTWLKYVTVVSSTGYIDLKNKNIKKVIFVLKVPTLLTLRLAIWRLFDVNE